MNKKFTDIQKLSDNRFLNLYHMDALDRKGNPFDYFFVSRRKEDEIKIKARDDKAEGIVIFPVLKEDSEKIVMIRQYRYPLDDFVYELPAGLIDEGENADIAAVREMKEETGLNFEIYQGGSSFFRKPFYMGPGFTDESCQCVFGYASGEISKKYMEDRESIDVLLVDKEEIKRILENKKVSIRAAYLLMAFLHTNASSPFGFL